MSSPANVAGLIPELAREGGWSQLIELVRLKNGWQQVVGATVAAHSMPERIQNGRLTVVVDSSPWLTQLGFFKEKMIAESNRMLGLERVFEVFLVVGRVTGKAAPRRPPQPVPLPPEAESLVNSMVGEVDDAEVRDALRSLVLLDLRQKR